MIDNNTVILGIAGPSGSGKTTLARAIQGGLAPAPSVLIMHDDYYHDLSDLPLAERAACNFDHPDALESERLIEHLGALRQGEAIYKPRYDFMRHTRTAEVELIAPAPLVIVEGILILADDNLRQCLDVAVYMDTPPDICLARRVLRDVRERGRSLESVIDQYLTTVRPMLAEFVLPSRRHAQVLVTQEAFMLGVEAVMRRVRAARERGFGR